MDNDRALQRLNEFADIYRKYESTSLMGRNTQLESEMVQLEPLIMELCRALVPNEVTGRAWPMKVWDRLPIVYDVVLKAMGVVKHAAEVEEIIGATGPALQSRSLHPWVWDAASSLWASGHFREAVGIAARSVNARLQEKTKRRDESETKLVGETFSKKPAEPGKPRLRLMEDDGSSTFTSLQDGVAAFGRGCFMALRNPSSHEHDDEETPEDVALEQLAAWSILARWIDDAAIEWPEAT